MNSKSLNLIEEVIISFGMWDSLEIAQDSIYLEFSDVELGNPKYNDSLNLSFRFSDKSFIVFFYNNIWDAEFLANFDFKNHFINEHFVLKVEKIKFLDFEYLNTFFYNYAKDKVLSLDGEFDIHNIRNDFFVFKYAIVSTSTIDFNQILINNTACTNIQVSYFRVTHLSIRQTYIFA